jgi:hypothetical protein
VIISVLMPGPVLNRKAARVLADLTAAAFASRNRSWRACAENLVHPGEGCLAVSVEAG